MKPWLGKGSPRMPGYPDTQTAPAPAGADRCAGGTQAHSVYCSCKRPPRIKNRLISQPAVDLHFDISGRPRGADPLNDAALERGVRLFNTVASMRAFFVIRFPLTTANRLSNSFYLQKVKRAVEFASHTSELFCKLFCVSLIFSGSSAVLYMKVASPAT